MPVFLSAGLYHSIARRRDGTLWTWGSNQWGQLGLGDPAIASRRIPTQVPGVTNAREVAVGGSTSLYLAADGFVPLWMACDPPIGPSCYGPTAFVLARAETSAAPRDLRGDISLPSDLQVASLCLGQK
jgi:hypothetical protein